MKTAVLFLALLLGMTALALRPEPARPETPARTRSVEPKADVQTCAEAPVAVRMPAPLTARAVEAAGPPAPPVEIDGGAAALLNVLERLLALSSLQKAQAQEILAERARRVGDYEQEMARRGWAKLSDFDHRMSEIRDLTVRRLMAVLDAGQAAAYARAVAAGIPEDSVTIEIPDGVVKLD